MRIIQSDCEVIYDGRGHTELARGVRLIIIKDDNTVIIHRTTGVKPTNYMGTVISFNEYDEHDDYNDIDIHYIEAKSKKETLTIINYRMIIDLRLPIIQDSADFDQIGTERQLQEWLSRNFSEVFGLNTVFIMREFQTGDGACDLLGFDKEDSKAVLVEVKRKAVKKDVYQIIRYRDAVLKAHDECNQDVSRILNNYGYDLNIMNHPHLVLASESVSDEVIKECENHDVSFVCTGSKWRHEAIPNEKARKNVNRDDNKDKSKQSLF